MPGSATFVPYAPPIDGAASVFVVLRYDRATKQSTVLPNVKCLSIHYVEGAVPPTAQFEYACDDTDPSSPFPSRVEDLWPLAASGPYVVQVDDELLVIEYPEGDDPFLCFHGFAEIPQVDLGPGGQRVSFVASGAAIRLWDDVVPGATYRPSADPQGGDPVATDLPCWFNPEGNPNCTPDANDDPPGADVDDGQPSAHPVFVWDDTAQGANFQVKWTLGKFVRYLAWTSNKDETYVKNPVAPQGTLDDYLKAVAPKDGQTYFDVEDPSTYDTTPIEVRSFDATGQCWIEAVADQLHKYGFEIFFNLEVDEDESDLEAGVLVPKNSIVIYRKDGLDRVAPKPLAYPPDRSDLASASPGFDGLALARDSHAVANEWSVETHPAEHEVTVVLAPGFEPDLADTADAASIAAFDLPKIEGASDERRKAYRYYTADETGYGHWDSKVAALSNAPLDLDDVLGKPEDGVAKYVKRPRPGSARLISVDDGKQPRKAILEISRDYDGEAPALWDPSDTTSTWRSLGATGWKLDKDSLAIWITAQNPESWRLPRADGSQAPGDMVRGITSQAAIGTTPETRRFFLRLTTVIEADRGIDAEAKKRDASPSRFAIRRRVDARDHFKKQVVTASSIYNAKSPPEDDPLRDDTDDAKAHASAMRTAHEFPPVAGTVTIPWISHAYGVGDAISGIDGRGIDLALGAGAPAGESPKYPLVVGYSWSCQDPQTTTLLLADRRGEPDRGHDEGRDR